MLYDCSDEYFDHRNKCSLEDLNTTEYMTHVWGGMFNETANPSIEKDCGIKSGYHYFSSEEDMNAFLGIVMKDKYRKQGFMNTIVSGNLSHKRTIFVGRFEYKSQFFDFKYDFGYDYSEKDAIFAFTQGNYSCDCNRSIFINEEWGEDTIPELGCGGEINLVEFHFEYLD